MVERMTPLGMWRPQANDMFYCARVLLSCTHDLPRYVGYLVVKADVSGEAHHIPVDIDER